MGAVHVSLFGHGRGEENRTQEKERIGGRRVLLTNYITCMNLLLLFSSTFYTSTNYYLFFSSTSFEEASAMGFIFSAYLLDISWRGRLLLWLAKPAISYLSKLITSASLDVIPWADFQSARKLTTFWACRGKAISTFPIRHLCRLPSRIRFDETPMTHPSTESLKARNYTTSAHLVVSACRSCWSKCADLYPFCI